MSTKLITLILKKTCPPLDTPVLTKNDGRTEKGQHRTSEPGRSVQEGQEEGFHAWCNVQTARAVRTVVVFPLRRCARMKRRRSEKWLLDVVTDGKEGFALMIL